MKAQKREKVRREKKMRPEMHEEVKNNDIDKNYKNRDKVKIMTRTREPDQGGKCKIIKKENNNDNNDIARRGKNRNVVLKKGQE